MNTSRSLTQRMHSFRLTVVRRSPLDHSLIPIKIDLNEATRDPSKRILVQPGDLLVLQESPGQAAVRYFADILFLDFFHEAIRGSRTLGNLRLLVEP